VGSRLSIAVKLISLSALHFAAEWGEPGATRIKDSVK
jgi:hypothetical protein